MKAKKIANTFRVDSGKHFHLKDFDPAATGHWHSKEHAAEALQEGIQRTAELQDKLYAQSNWALLLIFQAMDAAGKDGIIKHVMSGVNPQGCQVYSFKGPSELELQHDFLWRIGKDVPARGRIGIFAGSPPERRRRHRPGRIPRRRGRGRAGDDHVRPGQGGERTPVGR